jgi:hypothetical protein
MKLLKEQTDNIENDTFDNEQMILHLCDISDALDLNIAERKIIIDDNFSIIYKNQIMEVDSELINFAYSYIELENTYRLEAKVLIELILSRGEMDYISEDDLILLFNEIFIQHKLHTDKQAFKNKIVWLKRPD